MNMDFENAYLDILQNMEFVIIHIYRARPELLDFQVDKALESLLRVYQAERKERAAPVFNLGPLDQQIYDDVASVCAFHLGRPSTFSSSVEIIIEGVEDEEAKKELMETLAGHVTVDEIMACLKRIRQSIKQWTKQSGRQGYLTFANQFQL